MTGAEEILNVLEEGEGRIGLDVGSRSAKAAFLRDGERIPLRCDTMELLEGIPSLHVSKELEIVSCGYGRKRVPDAFSIPEIRAHATGVMKVLDIDDCTILDIGGQDFKVIRMENRSIRDFTMNDKCAAGTGRFLEKMASMLSMSLEELGKHEGSVKVLESTCSVFTETELISLMMEGRGRDELASGVIHSVFERVRPYLRSFPADTLVFTGGVSRMKGLARTISSNLDVEVMIPPDSQFTGAIGCLHSRSHHHHNGSSAGRTEG